MTEPAIKTRVLTKVRRQFLHKRPPEDDDVGQHTNLVATPEQLNEDATRILAPGAGLVETNRNIYAGSHFLNSHCKISTVRVDNHLKSRRVTLSFQLDESEILPWEYCVKRLQSYGDLELATWANRIKTYHEIHPKLMEGFIGMVKSDDPATHAALAMMKAQADQARQELEKNFAFKITMYAAKDRIMPCSMTYSEELLKDIGYNGVEEFAEWAKKHGIPKLFDGDSPLYISLSKRQMDPNLFEPAYFQEGPEFTLQLYDKEEGKKEIKVKFVCAIELAQEVVFGHIYIQRTDKVELNGEHKVSKSEDENAKFKEIKRDSDISCRSKETNEASEEDQVNSESDL